MEKKHREDDRKRKIEVRGDESPAEQEPPERSDEDAQSDSAALVEIPAEELAALRAKADELEERLKRVAADYANSQRRIGREAETRVEYAIQEFTREILPVADSIRRALGTAEETRDAKALLEGVRLVDKQFHDILARHGVEPVKAEVGESFDHSRHDVLAVQPTNEYPENAITEVVEQGYRIKDRVLRPAKVLVAKPVEEQEDELGA